MAGEPPFGSDEWTALNGPVHLRQAYADRAAMDPDERRLDLAIKKAEADAKAVAEIAAMTDKVIEQRTLEDRIAEKQVEAEEKRNERERIKRGLTPDSAGGPRTLVGRNLGTVQPRSIHWLWTGWVPKGYITLLAGETGAGKTTVLADITARVTTGNPWPGPIGIPGDRRTPGRVLWLGSEDGIEEMTVPRLMACGANLANVTEIQGVMQQGKRDTFSMQDDIEAVSGESASPVPDRSGLSMWSVSECAIGAKERRDRENRSGCNPVAEAVRARVPPAILREPSDVKRTDSTTGL